MTTSAEIAEIIKEHVARAKGANTHSAKLVVLSSLLGKLFGVKLEELIPGIETELKSKPLGLRGRADLIFSNVVFEVKVNLKRELDDAKKQLKRYLQVLHERMPDKRSIGIATDVLEFRAYVPIIKQGKVVDLEEVGSISIAEAPPLDSVLWLDSFIFSQPKIKPTAQDLKWRFGPGSPTYSIAVNELRHLWSEVEDQDDVKLKFDLWARSMEIVYGSKPELASFIDQTYLVTLVKLIVYLRLSGDDVIREDRVRSALTGEYFASYGIPNLIEEDFFAWILHPKIVSKTLRLVCDLAKELLKYDFSQVDEDFFKEIYQEIVERGQRHRIGEYYTPEWLVELILKEVIALWKERSAEPPRILDPACGSGTFLCNAIRMLREELSTRGWDPSKILDFILANLVGVDINPLAVTIARANYLIALGDLLYVGKPKVIPIYVADSIRLPRATETLLGGGVKVYEYRFNDFSLQIPADVAKDREKLGRVIEGFKSAINSYRVRRDKEEAYRVLERRLSTTVTAGELEVLKSTLSTILTQIDKGLDAIWVFMLSNMYAPIVLRESKFDIVVGNPPWIAMRYIENKDYQDFLKQQVLAYGLLESTHVHLFTHMEAATLFFCRSSDLYLKDGGLIAFVMPRSVLTGAFHHANFRQLRKPEMGLIKVLDLEGVSPLFNVPSCVLIAVKGSKTKYPVPARKYAGKLPERNVKLSEAIKHLTANECMYTPPKVSTTYSPYHGKVKAGATIIPRSLWFVDFVEHPILGIDASRPSVRSAEDALKEAKDPWKGVVLEGNVEANFIYATLLGGDLLPFGYYKLKPVVLPIEPQASKFEILDVDALRNRGFVLIANWLERAQKFWEERRTGKAEERFSRVVDRLNYNGLLSIQNPSKRYVVLYNASGKNIVSCVIDRQSLPAFQVLKAKISPKGFVAECKTYFYETDDEMEAHYICAILNSNVVNNRIKPLQTKGSFGERDIHRRPFMLPIPEFDRNDPLHVRLAELSKRCHAKVASLKLAEKSIASLRKKVREAIRRELNEIDKIVSQLPGLQAISDQRSC